MMFEILTFLTFFFGVAAAVLAGLSAKAWYVSSQLPVTKVPRDVAAPTRNLLGEQVSISMKEEAERRSVMGAAMVGFLEVANQSAALNRRAAWFSMLAAIFGALGLVTPEVNSFGVWIHWWCKPP
jgi:hypothetical protein